MKLKSSKICDQNGSRGAKIQATRFGAEWLHLADLEKTVHITFTIMMSIMVSSSSFSIAVLFTGTYSNKKQSTLPVSRF